MDLGINTSNLFLLFNKKKCIFYTDVELCTNFTPLVFQIHLGHLFLGLEQWLKNNIA